MYFYKFLLSIVFVFAVIHLAYPQPFLILKKEGTFRRSIYQAGDVLSFKLKNDKQRKNLVIKEMYGDTILFAAGPVTVDEIATVYIKNDYRNWNPSTYSFFFIIAGTGYVGLGAINDGKVEQGAWLTSAALVSSGILISLLKRKKVNIRNKIKLKIQEKLQ